MPADIARRSRQQPPGKRGIQPRQRTAFEGDPIVTLHADGIPRGVRLSLKMTEISLD
jgi:hypothetical protein